MFEASVQTGHSVRGPVLWVIAVCLFPLSLIGAELENSGDVQQPAQSQKKYTAAELEFFESRIRPVLVKHCYECHSAESKQLEAGLLVDTRAALLEGGDSGPAIVPGKPAESLLVEALHYDEFSYQMPPRGKLPAEVIADFEKWVSMGAPDPRTGPIAKPQGKAAGIDFESAREFWSLQPPQRSPQPEVADSKQVRRPIDAFLLAQLEKRGLTYATRADRRTLIRRASFGLTGLPPTPAEIREFLADESPQAWAKLIDRLLASPHYGERWARHWLDVARYAEDNTNMGPFNGPYKFAWRYRDWVIQALNEDVPYDEFIKRQLATDLMPETGPEDLPALGFVGLAPSYHKELNLAKVELDNRFADEWEDRVDGLGRGLLGLTVACARCHDHKYDPISNADYYALAGVFASTRQTTRPILDEELVKKSQPARDRVAVLEKEIATLDKQVKEAKAKAAEQKKVNQKKVTSKDASPATGADQKPAGKEAAEPVFDIAAATKTIAAHRKEIEDLKANTPNYELPMANVLTEETVLVAEENPNRMKLVYKAGEPRDLPIFIRGDASRQGKVVQRGFLQVLSPGDQRETYSENSGRLELAEAIIDRDNPLTARVIVNRVWGHHFGRGIVSSPSNFGKTGAPPTHPALLDDLAVRFMENGWSLKWLHREILLSAAYQQTSETPEKTAQVDPGNQWLGRFSRQRLDVEAFRDAILTANGQLDRSFGGPSAEADALANLRRTIYSTVSRHKLNDFLQAFDFPDPAIHCAVRSETTTPLQQLFILNSPFMRYQAAALAGTIRRETGSTFEEKINDVYERLFTRQPTAAELEIARQFLTDEKSDDPQVVAADTQPGAEFSGKRVIGKVPGLGNTWSMEMWFRNTLPNSERPITGYLFTRGRVTDAQANGDHLGITGNASTPGRLLVFNGNRLKKSLKGTTVIEPNTWHHVVLVREGSTVRVHLDGSAKPEIVGELPASYQPEIVDLLIGGRNDNFANFVGRIADVAIYNRALAADEIARHVAATKRLTMPAAPTDRLAEEIRASRPLAWWPLGGDQPGKTIARDVAGKDNHATYEAPAATAVDGPPDRLERYAHALLSSNEMLYVD